MLIGRAQRGTAHFWCNVDVLDTGGYPSAAFKAKRWKSSCLTVSAAAVLNTDEPCLVYAPSATVSGQFKRPRAAHGMTFGSSIDSRYRF